MKRLIVLPVAVALLGAAACASNNGYDTTSTYYSVGGERSDADLQVAGQVCDGRLGIVENGRTRPMPTSSACSPRAGSTGPRPAPCAKTSIATRGTRALRAMTS